MNNFVRMAGFVWESTRGLFGAERDDDSVSAFLRSYHKICTCRDDIYQCNILKLMITQKNLFETLLNWLAYTEKTS